MITNDRVVDESLRRQINSGNGYVCEKHFRKEQYECCKHTNSYFNLSNISRLRFTSRCATELSGHGPLEYSVKYYLQQREIFIYMKFVSHQNLLKPYKLIRYYIIDYIAANTYVIYKL